VTVTPGQTVTVSLSDKLNGTTSVDGYVIADAIRLSPVVPVTLIDDGDTGYSQSGNVVHWPGQGYGNDVRYNASFTDASTETFQWLFSDLEPGQYQVSATWTPHSNRATGAPYQINGVADILVNQQLWPSSFTADGAAWEVLGTVTISTGQTLTVTLSDHFSGGGLVDGYVIADAVRVTPWPGIPAQVLDEVNEFLVLNNGDAGTTCPNCSAWDFGQNLAYQREVYQLEGGSATEATWSAEVEPGLYQIAVSYSPYYSRGTNAQYTVSTATPGQSQTFTVNQRLPASYDQLNEGVISIENTAFQVLTSNYTVPFGDASITVRLPNTANGKIVADAVFIQRVAPLGLSPLMAEESVGSGPLSAVSGQLLTESLLAAAVVEATARWQASGLLSERQLAALSTVDYTIADLPGAQLGLASPVAGRIWLDRDGAGRGWIEESSRRTTDDGQRTSAGFDLLTAVMHEMGHIAGYDHGDAIAGELMDATLRAGDSGADAVDALFAGW
jgi:hypothetical protein